MRSAFFDSSGNIKCWHIIDYKTWKRETVKIQNDEHLKLSPFEIWNDTMLIDRLLNNWTLEQWF